MTENAAPPKSAHEEAKACWESNAAAWTVLARAGFDVYRDWLNTPAFLALLPDVRGQQGLDVGCGEGYNTRLLADRGAVMTAIDASPTFIAYAAAADSSSIAYSIADAMTLPFAGSAFDFATACMSLMDIGLLPEALREIFRVLRPGGFLQFSIVHPCFSPPHRRNLRDDTGHTYAIEVGDYFRHLGGEQVDEWLFSAAPAAAKAGLRPFRVPRFTRTLSDWLNLLTETGFVLERIHEPRPSDDVVRNCPALQDAQVVAYFLHVRVRRPPAPPPMPPDGC